MCAVPLAQGPIIPGTEHTSLRDNVKIIKITKREKGWGTSVLVYTELVVGHGMTTRCRAKAGDATQGSRFKDLQAQVT